jgi:hypothetical protein
MTNGFDKLLRESLTADGSADHGAECLDAALVAGWFDGTLAHAERAAVEAHAASCPRCQATIAALVRTDRPSPRVWWRAPAIQWLLPVAVAGAAALVVWIGMRRPDDSFVPPAPESVARLASPAPTPAELRRSTAAERASSSDQAGAAAAARPAPPQAAEAREKVSDSARHDMATKASAPPAETANAESLSAFAPRVEPLRQQAGTAVPVPQSPVPPNASSPPAAAPSPVPPNASPPPAVAPRAGAVGGIPPAADTTTVREALEPAENNRARSLVQSVGAGAGRGGRALILSPVGTVRWRIAGTGQVERSVDSGLTWQTQTTGTVAVLTAGIAPSTNICWLVGRRGVVLKTSDGGQTWARIAVPEELDLLAVVADDDKVASVTAAGGRQFHTTDGGATWR